VSLSCESSSGAKWGISRRIHVSEISPPFSPVFGKHYPSGGIPLPGRLRRKLYYEFRGSINGSVTSGPLGLRFHTSDGIDLRGTLEAKSANFARGTALTVNAANDSMGVDLKTTFDVATKSYRGTLAVSFGLDQSSPAEQAATCTVQ
jgi:hypothetical protein